MGDIIREDRIGKERRGDLVKMRWGGGMMGGGRRKRVGSWV